MDVDRSVDVCARSVGVTHVALPRLRVGYLCS
jgi:hypothetical protein